MANPYRELFAAPGSVRFSLAGFVARLPIAMIAIGIITMLSQLHGSYGLASGVAAVFVLTSALMAPQISRLVDRYGQFRVLPFAAAISVVGILVLLACSRWQAPNWTLFVAAFLAGFIPSMPAMIRARWTAIFRGSPQLKTAYAMESVVDELCFIIGPPLAVGLSVALFPQAGPLVAVLLLAVGVFALVMQRGTEPPVQPASNNGRRGESIIRLSTVRWLALLMLALGAIVGTIDIVSVAFAAELEKPAAASIVLSLYALGSCGAGLLFGAIQWQWSLTRLLFWSGLATALSTLPLLLVGNIASLALVMFISGLFFAPTMIVCMALIEQSVPLERLTEGLTWLISGLNVGIAAGAVSAGQMVDLHGAKAGFVVALVAAAVVLFAAVFGSRHIAATLANQCNTSPPSNSRTSTELNS